MNLIANFLYGQTLFQATYPTSQMNARLAQVARFFISYCPDTESMLEEETEEFILSPDEFLSILSSHVQSAMDYVKDDTIRFFLAYGLRHLERVKGEQPPVDA